MPPFRQRFPVDEPAEEPDADGWTLVQPASASATPASDDGWTLVQSAQKPAAAAPREPTTYLQDVGRYAAGEVKGFVRGLTDLVRPSTYVDLAKGVATGIHDLPAYVSGFSMDDVRRAPGQLAEAAGEFVQDPEAVGRTLGQVVAGKAGITPAGAVRVAGAVPAAAKAVVPTAIRAAGTAAEAVSPDVTGLVSPRIAHLQRLAIRAKKAMAQPATTEAVGRLVKTPTGPSTTEVLGGILDELRGESPSPSVELPPQPTLPPGYTPRTSATTRPALSVVRRSAPASALAPEASTAAEPIAGTSVIKPAASGPAPGYVRLYRGESPSAQAGPQAGQTFTDDPLAALYYAKQGGGAGRLFHIDVPEEEAATYKTADPTGQGVHILPPDLAEAARQPKPAPLVPVSSAVSRVPAAVRPYFLKSEAQLADEAAAASAPRSTPSGSIAVEELPTSWKSRVAQDVLPSTGALGKDVIRAFAQEITDQGLSVGQAIAAISTNRTLSLPIRNQLLGALMSARSGG